MNLAQKSQIVKEIAQDLGFQFCTIAKAEFLEDQAPKLEDWLKQGYQGQMSYLENHFDKRLDPRKLVEGSRSVVSLAYNYFPNQNLNLPYKIAKYAYGQDYHHVIKSILTVFLERIREKIGQVQGRAFVDSAPVMERVWAQKSGMGWIGKNTLLLNPKAGSFFFLAELITDLELEADMPFPRDFCGSCTRCIDACPTQALSPYSLDARKCISYLTIELKEAIDESFRGKMQDWVFGCDICQDVCPWNRRSKAHSQPLFDPPQELKDLKKNDWNELTEFTFAKVFGKSALKRTGYKGLKRNLAFVQSESSSVDAELSPNLDPIHDGTSC
jgi:epoxyqueuosine reductase